jgi:hypothetical protein
MKYTYKSVKIENEFYCRDMPWHVPALGLVKSYLIIPGIMINLQTNVLI